MEKNITETTIKIHELYEECKVVFEPSTDLLKEVSNFEDKDERNFYALLCDFFLQQKQREAIEKGIF